MISIWEKETFFATQDIVIAGSGFVGLWSAYYLKRKNPLLRITVVDRGIIPTGASTRNAGFACFGSLSELMHDAQTMGTDKMLQLVEMRFKGLQKIQKIFKKDEIDFELSGGFELYHDQDSLSHKDLNENIHYLNSLLKPITGSKHTFQSVDEKINEFRFGQTRHLLKNNFEGALHSGKLIQALLKRVQALGVQLFTQTEVKEILREADHITLSTNHFVLKTRQLLVCTNAFAKQLLPQLEIVPARGQVLLTSPLQNLPWKGTFHSDEGFYYFRNLGKKVLLGGARNKSLPEEEITEMQTTEIIQFELERYLNDVILPEQKGNYTIENRWSGIMAMGPEKMPIIKELEPGVFCAVRMSGMGVALAPVVGQLLSKMML